MSVATDLFKGTQYQRAKRDLLLSIKREKEKIRSVKKSSSGLLSKVAREFSETRGRPLYYPAIFSGLGNGPLVELLDGSVKYDFITGIGTHFFGHSDLDLISVAVHAASQNVVMQGNLESGIEVKDFLKTLLSQSGQRLKMGWLSLSGTMANENALKVIRQKKSPAYKLIAFGDCFHGRSIVMADITDNEEYRKGLHRYYDALYIPFFNPKDSSSIEKSISALKGHLVQHRDEIAGFVFELVQGEGGFKQAPREFFTRLMDICRDEKLTIWVDEVQTVGRTGELFAFQKFELDKYADVVTVGKMLQNCATLYTEEYNPKPGLLAGTFCGSTVSLRVGTRILERFKEEKFFGKEGKIAQAEKWAVQGLKNLQEKLGKNNISEIEAIGAMVSWKFRNGFLEETKKFILKAFEEGVILYYCGHGPYKIRFLLPVGGMKENDYMGAMKILERTIKKLL